MLNSDLLHMLQKQQQLVTTLPYSIPKLHNMCSDIACATKLTGVTLKWKTKHGALKLCGGTKIKESFIRRQLAGQLDCFGEIFYHLSRLGQVLNLFSEMFKCRIKYVHPVSADK